MRSNTPWASLRRTIVAVALLGPGLAPAQPAALPLRLYALDCGRIDFADMKVFSDTGEHDGEKGLMPVSCFLIRHGAEWMLCDAGLGDEIAASPTGKTVVDLHFIVPRTLASQLAVLGLQPDDIRYVGLSHLHADHSGNAALFPNAIFLVSPAELAWAAGSPAPDGVAVDRVQSVQRSRIRPVPGDEDVFGDGTVRLISTPGHTPGHHSLLVRLHRSGAILLSGDVAHFQVNYDHSLVPTGNVSRAETIASIGRVKGLAAHYHARVIIQHVAGVLDAFPKPPGFLD